MSRTAEIRRGRKPRSRDLPAAIAVVMGIVLSSCAVASEDAYLDLLDQEATKVGGVTTDTEVNVAGPGPAPSRTAFEASLRDGHVGTYSFYRRLPERSREEIFHDYRSGASMEALRGKIIDRYLHP